MCHFLIILLLSMLPRLPSEEKHEVLLFQASQPHVQGCHTDGLQTIYTTEISQRYKSGLDLLC